MEYKTLSREHEAVIKILSSYTKEEVRYATAALCIALHNDGFIAPEGGLVRSLSLCGRAFNFESMLNVGITQLSPLRGTYQGVCAEMDPLVARRALAIKPGFCKLAVTDINNMLMYTPLFDSAGVCLKLERGEPPNYNILWADFCAKLGWRQFEAFTRFARNRAGTPGISVCAGTVMLGRHWPETLARHKGKMSEQAAVLQTLANGFVCNNIDAKLLLAVTYSGGSGDASSYGRPMFNFAFALGDVNALPSRYQLNSFTLLRSDNAKYYAAVRKRMKEAAASYETLRPIEAV
jgi:hypothetical protein